MDFKDALVKKYYDKFCKLRSVRDQDRVIYFGRHMDENPQQAFVQYDNYVVVSFNIDVVDIIVDIICDYQSAIDPELLFRFVLVTSFAGIPEFLARILHRYEYIYFSSFPLATRYIRESWRIIDHGHGIAMATLIINSPNVPTCNRLLSEIADTAIQLWDHHVFRVVISSRDYEYKVDWTKRLLKPLVDVIMSMLATGYNAMHKSELFRAWSCTGTDWLLLRYILSLDIYPSAEDMIGIFQTMDNSSVLFADDIIRLVEIFIDLGIPMERMVALLDVGMTYYRRTNDSRVIDYLLDIGLPASYLKDRYTNIIFRHLYESSLG